MSQSREPRSTGQRRTRSNRRTKAETPRKSRRSASRSPKDPPVLARGYSANVTTVRSRTSSRKPRRRYDVPLSTPGAEIRLPSLPRLHIGWRVVSFLLVAVLGYLLYQAWTMPDFRVNGAEIQGLQRLTSAEVNRVLGLNGQPVFLLDVGQMEDRLQAAFPEFSSVSVSVDFPNLVSVTVTERMPVLAWEQQGSLLLVDAQGMAFPLRRTEMAQPEIRVQANGLPVSAAAEITDADLAEALAAGTRPDESSLLPGVTTEARPLLAPEMIRSILEVARYAPEGAPLVYDTMHGLGWNDPAGWQVYLGNLQDVEMKLKVYAGLVNHLQAEGTQPQLVSVEYVHAPYYRLER